MISLFISIGVAIIYAVIRSHHDRWLYHGPWKTFAFIEGVFVDLVVIVLSWLAFGGLWWSMILNALIFAFVFWLVFDCLIGYTLTGSILYIGSQGFDKKMRATFKYDLPLLGWKKTGAIRLIIVKLWWLLVLIGGYVSI